MVRFKGQEDASAGERELPADTTGNECHLESGKIFVTYISILIVTFIHFILIVIGRIILPFDLNLLRFSIP